MVTILGVGGNYEKIETRGRFFFHFSCGVPPGGA